MKKNPAESTFLLLSNYSFELPETNVADLVFLWLSLYPGKWVVAAIVEAIYQGRYKVESVSRILESWSARGYPVHHFDYDFADVVCKKLANLSSYRASDFRHMYEGSMQYLENAVLEQTLPNKTIENEESKVEYSPDKNIKQQVSLGRKNTPNQKIGQHEQLVVRLIA
jgi:hypothetical protein